MIPLHGANLVGLANLGNTCYFNATLQMLLACEEVCTMFGSPSDGGRQHVQSGKDLGVLPAKDLRLQMGKLCEGLGTDMYVHEQQQKRTTLQEREAILAQELKKNSSNGGGGGGGKTEQIGNEEPLETYVTPTSLRVLAGEGHVEFSTGR